MPDAAKPSITANSVIEGMRAVSRSERYAHLVPRDAAVYYRIACDYCRPGNLPMAAVNAIGPETRLALLDQMTWEGQGTFYALRKALIEQETRALIEHKGVTQVVVMGAGYDALALRLHKQHPDVQFFEIDRPVMHERKQGILKLGRQKAGADFIDLFRPEQNLHFLSADLAETPVDRVLRGTDGFDPGKPTLFIAEGVTMYLPEKANREMFKAMHRACDHQGYALFGALGKLEQHRLGADTAMKQHKEKYQWAVPYEQMPAFLQESGLKLLGAATYQDLQNAAPDRSLQRPLRNGEEKQRMSQLVGENYYLTEIMPENASFEQPEIGSVRLMPALSGPGARR